MSSNNDHTVMAFILGAAAGGLAALLLAPESGRDTRRRLRDGAEDYYDRGSDRVRELAGDTRDRASDVSDTVKDHVSGVGRTARTQVEAMREAAEEAKEAYLKERRRQARG